MAAAAADICVGRDVLGRALRLHQHIAAAIGAEGIAQSDPTVCAPKHDVAVARARGCQAALALRRLRRRHTRARHALGCQRHAAHRHVIGLEQVNAAACGLRAQRAHRRFQLVHRLTQRAAGAQTEAGRHDVSRAIVAGVVRHVRVQNVAGRGRKPYRAGGKQDLAHRQVATRHQLRQRRRTRALKHAGAAHGERAAGLHVNAGARRAHVRTRTQTHRPSGDHAHVAAAAADICVDRDVCPRAQGLQEHVPRAMAAHSHAIGICVAQRQAARRGAQHDGAVASAGAQVGLAAGLCATGARAAQAVDGDRQAVDHQGIGFQHKHAATASSTREGGHGGLQCVARCAHATGRTGLHQETRSADVYQCVGIPVGDGAACDQRDIARALNFAQRQAGARLHANVAHGFERASGQDHGRASLQVDGAAHGIGFGAVVRAVGAHQVGMGAQGQDGACAQTHGTRGRHVGDCGQGQREVAVGGRQGLHRHHAGGDGRVAGVAQLGFEQGQRAAGSRFHQANISAASVAQAGCVDFSGKQVNTGDRVHQEGCALQGLAAHAVSQAGIGFIALLHVAGARVQRDVLQGAGLAQVGRRQQSVADVDVASGIQLD